MTASHEPFMRQALELAEQALKRDEFPVGCLLVHKGDVIASGRRTGTNKTIPSEIEHAEIIALRNLEKMADPVDRKEITLYSTLEPCLMCFGAILISGIGTVVYAYEDAMGGGTACDRSTLPPLYSCNGVTIVAGILRKESLRLFQRYFSNPRIDYWRGSLLAEYTLKQT